MIEEASHIDAGSFKAYEPLISDVRLDKRSALLGNTLINVRRLTMLYMAMFVQERQWLQTQVFIQLNFLSSGYVLVVRPFDRAYLNFLNILNESIVLVVSYCILPLQDMGNDPEQLYEIGNYTVYPFYVLATMNLILILGVGIRDANR